LKRETPPQTLESRNECCFQVDTTAEGMLMNDWLVLLGRIGLSWIFIDSGWSKIAGYAGAQQYMESGGVPGVLLPLVIAIELGGGIAILLGAFTRWVPLVLAVFSIAAAILFHLPHYADQMQAINVWKNVAMAGGFCVLAAHGAGRYSIDAKLGRH
jgi:putative oxidoreductase